ncbi:MAG TPA: hypothetical protein VG994_03255 [Steroidobacteraceae bacterium]|nr:hypothetical protein [Steroidobacteraceae bacterium]
MAWVRAHVARGRSLAGTPLVGTSRVGTPLVGTSLAGTLLYFGPASPGCRNADPSFVLCV